MGQDPAEVRQNIEATRADMTDTLDAIGDRVSPSQIAARRKAAARDRFGRMRSAVMGQSSSAHHSASEGASRGKEALSNAPDAALGQTQGNPLAAGLIAFGAGLVAAAILPESREEQRMARKLEPQLSQTAEELQAAGQYTASSVKDSAQQEAQGIKETAADAGQQVKERSQQAAQDVKDQSAQKASEARRDTPAG